MITLAFDSVAKVASVAVLDGERPLAIYSIDNGLTQSELLLPMAEAALSSLGLKFDDVELLSCTTGPGSFTGVRIGVALVKGIAFGRDLPCIGVSALDALAENLSGLTGVIVPCMDARRNQVYTAVYEGTSEGLTKLTADLAISASELAQRLKEFSGKPIYLVGDGYQVAKRALLAEGIEILGTPKLLMNENAYSCGIIAQRKLNSGERGGDLDISPTYLRLPQAERERLEKQNQK